MSLIIPKSKKVFWIFLAIAGLAVFLFALRASAFYTIYGCPDCGNFTSVVYTTGGTGDLLKDTDYVSSASFGWNAGATDYWNIAERFIPVQDTRVCVVRSKLQFDPAWGSTPCNPPNPYKEQDMRLQISVDSPYPAFSTNYHPTAGVAVVSNCTSDIDPITPPSQQAPAFVWFQFQSCWTAYANHTYWFEFSLRNMGYRETKWQAYQTERGAFVIGKGFGEVSENSWQDTGRNWSFEIINDLSQAQNEMPPSSASYGFENKDFGLLGNMFRDVVVFLFFPDQANLERFGNLWDTIRLKPPIGYFTAVKDEFANIGIGTANIAFDTTAAAGIITPLRTGIIVILWIMFAFWIFHRLRKLEL